MPDPELLPAPSVAPPPPAAQPREPDPGAERANGTLDFLLRRMRLKSDFPALSEAIRRINELARSESEKLDNVSAAILQDFSLTNKILRLVNSSYYRGAGKEPISTMSRAVMMLGFEAVRSLAVSLTLFEHMGDRGRAAKLREEFVRASLRGAIARTISGEADRDSEEAYLGAMFHRLGRLLTLYYFPEEFDEIERQRSQLGLDEESAAQRVLGVGYEELGAGVGHSWGFPAPLVRCMAPLPPDAPAPSPQNREVRLRVLANFAAELGDAVETADSGARQAAIDALLARYGRSLGIAHRDVTATLQVAAGQVRELADALPMSLSSMPLGRRILDVECPHRRDHDRGQRHGSSDSDGRSPAAATAPDATETGAPARSAASQPPEAPAAETQVGAGGEHDPAILAAGLVDLSRTLAEQSPLSDVIRLALETLYRGLAPQRILFAIRDARTSTLLGRIGLGAGMPELAKTFRAPLDLPGDLFAATAAKGADLLISDSAAENIASRIPVWYRTHFGAGSFLLLPVMLKESPVAMIYLDRAGARELVIGEQQLSMVRAIRNQVVLAFRQSRSG
jgi:HD-like signal output (HDOD) protein